MVSKRIDDTKLQIKKDAFLAAYAECGNVTVAAEQAGICRTQHYAWMKDDPAYAEQFATAEDMAVDRLEQEARRRAVGGVDEPVFYQGTVVGYIKKYSDTLLIFLLKGLRPEKYRDFQAIEQARLALERERLELERRKAGMNADGSDDEGDEHGVVILPERMMDEQAALLEEGKKVE